MKICKTVISAALLLSFFSAAICAQTPGPAPKRPRPEKAGTRQAPGARRAQGAAGQKRMSGLISLEVSREHTMTDRLLLVCESFADKLEKKAPLLPGTLMQAADLTRAFVQDRQEMQEEKYIFPVFIRANMEPTLIATLLEQHQAGRRLIEGIRIKLREQPTPAGDAFVAASLRAFVRMYRPHLAYENTMLLPEFRDLVSSAEYTGLETSFRSEESRRQQEKGAENVMELIALLENSLGISDISRYNPPR
jgi:hemerythrin-like domain-containing protein